MAAFRVPPFEHGLSLVLRIYGSQNLNLIRLEQCIKKISESGNFMRSGSPLTIRKGKSGHSSRPAREFGLK